MVVGNHQCNAANHNQSKPQFQLELSLFLNSIKGEKFIFKTGNGIIFSTSRPLINRLILQKISDFCEGVQNSFSKQEMDLSKQEMDLS